MDAILAKPAVSACFPVMEKWTSCLVSGALLIP